MSLWSRDELHVVLHPERVGLLHARRRLTSRGWRRDVVAEGVFPCEPAQPGAGWQRALQTLEAALPPFSRHGMQVNVVLSSHFMQYLLLPWLDKLSDDEELALAQHRFKEIYGSAAATWSVRVSPAKVGAARLASAVDPALLEALRRVLAAHSLQVRSVQPHLMTAYNSCLSGLRGRSGWVAVLEPGALCLALLEQGHPAWLRKMRIGEGWQREMAALLEREACLAGTDADDVLLWAPHLGSAEVPAVGRWTIRPLRPDGGGRPLEHGCALATEVAHAQA